MDLDTGIKYQKHCERLPSVGNESDTYVISCYFTLLFVSFWFEIFEFDNSNNLKTKNKKTRTWNDEYDDERIVLFGQ